MRNRPLSPVLWTLALLGFSGCTAVSKTAGPNGQISPPQLRVAADGRTLVQELSDGSSRPFFWLGDTAWNLHRLRRGAIDRYLEDRAAKGFNVIQGPVLDWSGVTDRKPLARANGYGHNAYSGKKGSPELNADVPGPLDNDYFDQTDYIIERAASLGMYVALLPFWAQGINDLAGSPEGLARLERIGELLGARYRGRGNVLWIVGGEAAGESRPSGVKALAAGLERGHGGRNLMSIHPGGQKSSSAGAWRAPGESGEYAYHEAPWLDFNMIQSGHAVRDGATYHRVARDYAQAPVKPTLEAEYWYEGMPNEHGELSTAYDQRKGGYWSVFAGGFGYTYGASGIWQFTAGDEAWDENDYRSVDDWETALRYEGSSQMIHLRRLMESRPLARRIPDRSVILAGAGASGDGAADHVAATRDSMPDGGGATYLMVYIPAPQDITLDTRVIDPSLLKAWWYDPRSGRATLFRGDFANAGTLEVPARSEGPDWVLVVDDATADYPAPGRPGD